MFVQCTLRRRSIAVTAVLSGVLMAAIAYRAFRLHRLVVLRPSDLADGLGYVTVANAREFSHRYADFSNADLGKALADLSDQFDQNVNRLAHERFASGFYRCIPAVGGVTESPTTSPFVFARSNPQDRTSPLEIVELTRQEFPEIWDSNAELVWLRAELRKRDRGVTPMQPAVPPRSSLHVLGGE